jgi:mono/diheme cytochrome c family protein
MKSRPRQVKQVFQTNCYRCHGEKGAEEGGIAFITDLARLVERRKIVPGDLKGSKVYKKGREMRAQRLN